MSSTTANLATTTSSSSSTISELGQTFFGILGVHALGYALKKVLQHEAWAHCPPKPPTRPPTASEAHTLAQG